MLRDVRFENFRILRDAVLPLQPLTVLVGANSSGKSTALLGLRRIVESLAYGQPLLVPTDRSLSPEARDRDISVRAQFSAPWDGLSVEVRASKRTGSVFGFDGDPTLNRQDAHKWLRGMRIFELLATPIRSPWTLEQNVALGEHGERLVIVLDRLRDDEPERFAELNAAVAEWFGEFDHILFRTPGQGARSLALRRTSDRAAVEASELSEGTLFALALLTLSHLPSPPTLACFEEPERGIHPRLLRRVFDALVRLSNPNLAGDRRPPTQVLVTTHSPYFLDLFRDMPEAVVVAERRGDDATFEALRDRQDLDEVLRGGPLGDVWYSGVLGGVPTKG